VSAVNLEKFDAELRAAGVRFVGCASTGRVDLAADATDADRALAADVLARHDPRPSLAQWIAAAREPARRRAELLQVRAAMIRREAPKADLDALDALADAAQAAVDAALGG